MEVDTLRKHWAQSVIVVWTAARLSGRNDRPHPAARPRRTSQPAREVADLLAAVAEQVVDRGEAGGVVADGVLRGHRRCRRAAGSPPGRCGGRPC